MVKKVLKFGGTSVGTIERIQHVANIIKKEHDAGNKIIAVVSAMSGKTNELIKIIKNISNNFDKRELDVLLSIRRTSYLCFYLAGALIKLNVKAKSWMNWQIPILTEGEHSNARIVNMNIKKINEYLKKGVAIIPGFQGISKNGDITTIGRGGSDATAVALQKFLMLIVVKFIQMLMEFFLLILIKYQLQKKLKKFLMMKC